MSSPNLPVSAPSCGIVLGLAGHFGLKAGVVINKYDLNEEIATEIEHSLREREAMFLGRIPFGEEVKEAITEGRAVLEHSDGPVSRAVRVIAESIIGLAAETRGAGRMSKS